MESFINFPISLCSSQNNNRNLDAYLEQCQALHQYEDERTNTGQKYQLCELLHTIEILEPIRLIVSLLPERVEGGTVLDQVLGHHGDRAHNAKYLVRDLYLLTHC